MGERYFRLKGTPSGSVTLGLYHDMVDPSDGPGRENITFETIAELRETVEALNEILDAVPALELSRWKNFDMSLADE